MRRRSVRALVGLFALTTVLSLPGMTRGQGVTRSDEWQRTLIVAVSTEPQTFDPAVNVAEISTYRYYPNIYESLLQYAPDGELRPMLAREWEVRDDGLRYRFRLVKDAKFSDGTPFDAHAVKFAFERLLGLGKGFVAPYSAIKAVDVVDDHTADIVLKERFAPLLALVASKFGGIFVSPAAVRGHDVNSDRAQAWLHSHTAGTGPYVLESWVPQSRIVLVRNPHYRLGWRPGQIERVVYTMVGEPSTMRQALEGGKVDLAEEIPPSLVEALRNSRDVVVATEISYSHYGQALYLNHTKTPFDKADVRKALAYAIDYDRLLPVWQGTATGASGPFPAGFKPWVASQGVVRYRQDLAKAREYLARAGLSVPMTPPLRLDMLWQAGFTAMRDMAQLIAEDWAKLGIQVNIVETPLPVWREAIWKHSFEVAFMQLPLRYGDPDSLVSLFYPSREFRYRGWNPGYRNPRVDQLIELGRSTLDPAKRREYYAEFQRLVTEDVVMIHLVDKLDAFAYRREVEGLVWNPNYGPHYRAYEMRKNPGAK